MFISELTEVKHQHEAEIKELHHELETLRQEYWKEMVDKMEAQAQVSWILLDQVEE